MNNYMKLKRERQVLPCSKVSDNKCRKKDGHDDPHLATILGASWIDQESL